MTRKVLYEDVVPYDLPSAWSALAGPCTGVIQLPVTVYWGPIRHFDVGDRDQRRYAYQQLVREGTSDVQERLLNPILLQYDWPSLVLPSRCRAAWETAFADLGMTSILAVSQDDLLERVTALLLEQLAANGFALAGAGAIREHGLTNRPTHDIDLFAQSTLTTEQFAAAVTRTRQVLTDHGLDVDLVRRHPLFARFLVRADAEDAIEVDLAVNWRALPPVELRLGPVLAESDAVAGKLSAIYSRGEVRDFLDLDAIRGSGRYTDNDLLTLGKEHDDGFDPQMFAQQLSRIAYMPASYAAQYGVDQDTFESIRDRTLSWAQHLRDRSSGA